MKIFAKSMSLRSIYKPGHAIKKQAVKKQNMFWNTYSKIVSLRWSRSQFFLWPDPKAGAAFFKAAPAASFWQAKEESLVLVTHMTQEQFIKRKYDPEKTCTNNSLFKSSK